MILRRALDALLDHPLSLLSSEGSLVLVVFRSFRECVFSVPKLSVLKRQGDLQSKTCAGVALLSRLPRQSFLSFRSNTIYKDDGIACLPACMQGPLVHHLDKERREGRIAVGDPKLEMVQVLPLTIRFRYTDLLACCFA